MGNTLQKSQETQVKDLGQLQQEDSNFICEICTKLMLSVRKLKNGSLCKHAFCLDCIAKYIEVTVEETTGCIECPILNCKQLDKLKKIKCPNGKKNFCFLCKISWHAGYWCNESRHLRDRNEIVGSGCRDIKCKDQEQRVAEILPPSSSTLLGGQNMNLVDHTSPWEVGQLINVNLSPWTEFYQTGNSSIPAVQSTERALPDLYLSQFTPPTVLASHQYLP